MAKKTYYIKDDGHIGICINEKKVIKISIKLPYTTSVKKEQEAIEANYLFKSNKIYCKTVDKDIPNENSDIELTPIEDVKTLQEAKQYLAGEEILVAANASKEKVIEIAKEHGISFPNLQ